MQTLRKGLVIALITVSIISVLSISTFAFDQGDIISMWANGLEGNMTQDTTSVYGGIYQSLNQKQIDTINAVYKDNEKNTVAYEITYSYTPLSMGHKEQFLQFYILYNTTKKIRVTYSVEYQEAYDEVNSTTLNGFNCVESVEIGTDVSDRLTRGATYFGYIYPNEYFGYSYTYNSAVPAIRVRVNFNNAGRVRIKVTVQFYNDGEIMDYIGNHDDIWSEIQTVIQSGNLTQIGQYIRVIINIDFVFKLFIVNIIAIIIAMAYNWLRSL